MQNDSTLLAAPSLAGYLDSSGFAKPVAISMKEYGRHSIYSARGSRKKGFYHDGVQVENLAYNQSRKLDNSPTNDRSSSQSDEFTHIDRATTRFETKQQR